MFAVAIYNLLVEMLHHHHTLLTVKKTTKVGVYSHVGKDGVIVTLP